MIYDVYARRRYKAQARTDIRTRFWPTMLTALLEIIPITLIEIINRVGTMAVQTDATDPDGIRLYAISMVVYFLATVFISAPLRFGAKHYFVARARGQEASPMLIMTCFMSGKKYWTSIKLLVGITAYSLGWIALLVVGVILVLLFALTGSIGLTTIGLFLLVPLSLFMAVKIRRYDGAYIRMIDTPDASVMDSISSCAPVFKQHNWELLMFDLSFLLWFLLGILTFGIVMIYAIAYVEIAFVHYFDALNGTNEKTEQLDG